jgi:mono/diheme cytochrome c family protein
MKRASVAGMPLAIALALVLSVPLAAPVSGADGKAPLDGQALFEKKCGACHRLSLTTDRREWKPEWRRIVDRMARKRDGWISAEEAAAIVEYLGSDYGKD